MIDLLKKMCCSRRTCALSCSICPAGPTSPSPTRFACSGSGSGAGWSMGMALYWFGLEMEKGGNVGARGATETAAVL